MIPVVADFSELEEDILRITGDTVFCSVTTGDARGRMLHPIFTIRDGRPLWPGGHRQDAAQDPAHRRESAPLVRLSDAFARHRLRRLRRQLGHGRRRARRGVAAVRDTPTPLGWGPEGLAGYGPDEWRSELFTPLRLEPWRIQVMTGDNYPTGDLGGRVWRA